MRGFTEEGGLGCDPEDTELECTVFHSDPRAGWDQGILAQCVAGARTMCDAKGEGPWGECDHIR